MIKLLRGLLLLQVILAPSARADTCCYRIPVRIDISTSQQAFGYLFLYGNEIRGSSGTREHVVAFGMNAPSDASRLWEGIPYDFKSIELSGRTVTVKFEEGNSERQMDRHEFRIGNVSHFLTAGGLELYDSPDVLEEDESVKFLGKVTLYPRLSSFRVERIGPVGGKLPESGQKKSGI